MTEPTVIDGVILAEAEGIIADIARLKARMTHLPRDRKISVAITEIEGGALWLGDWVREAKSRMQDSIDRKQGGLVG